MYFCVLEALQNVAKYAGEASATVRLFARDHELDFEVADDGEGFDPAATPMGSGLQNMADRLAALGGSIEIRSAPGRGTVVSGRLSLRVSDDRKARTDPSPRMRRPMPSFPGPGARG